MDPAQIIARKRDGHRLTADQISAFVRGYTSGEIPDYQMAALAMAIYLRGMDAGETAALTHQMLHSGAVLAWPPARGPVADKHSTGGVGDKTSLLLAPLLASCGVRVPMISGRGLGATGGTLDKLESIRGYRTDLSVAEICEIVERVGCVISGATAEIAPADRKLYALRDVTATVGSIPLITASILSKKLAESPTALVFDVKWGTGTFMKSLDAARRLARSLVHTAAEMGVKSTALITDMNQPLGRMVGNGVEVDEAVDALSGKGPDDLLELTVRLAAELLISTGLSASREDAARKLRQKIDSGEGLAKLREMVAAQGGELDCPREREPAADWQAPRAGCVSAVDGEVLGNILVGLGGGRRVITDRINPAVGLEILFRVGDKVDRGQPLVRIFAPRRFVERAEQMLARAITIGPEAAAPAPLVQERIEP